MIKVFLCEDEFVVREGIKNLIDWKGNGFEFVGEASDGELALPMLRELRPDILITDIKMPFMDGLALSRIVREEMPEVEIVILSGYEEFEYAKAGIRLGVAQYLTKPISAGDLLRELNILKEKIIAANKENARRQEEVIGRIEDMFKEYKYVKSGDEPRSDELFDSLYDEFDIKGIATKRIDKDHIKNFLKRGSREEIPGFIEAFISAAGEDALKSYIFRQYIVVDSYFAISAFLDEIGAGDNSTIPEVNKETVKNEHNAINYIEEIIRLAIESRDSVSQNRYSELVADAIRYIEENFSDDELSLNVLAGVVNVSPNHLSTIFTHETGVNFIKFLTEFRMTKAKEMLKCTNLRSSEISEKVGYKDPHYFSYMFKKNTGMTPTQFRGGSKADDDEE